MLILQIQKKPNDSFDYMERLVNDGSPSGFTQIHNTSVQTNPLYCKEFNVKILYPRIGEIVSRGSCGHNNIISSEEHFIYIHPDWELIQEKIHAIGDVADGMIVIPTSSSRTVKIKGTNSFLKLHYPGIIGRLPRDLGDLQLSFAVEITRVLNEAKQQGKLLRCFDFMPEYYGRVVKAYDTEIGFVCREMPKYDDAQYYVPAFSLFSKDSHKPYEEKILVQLLQVHSNNSLSFLLNEICFPLIDVFFFCAFNLGLLPEMHSQNIVFLFDSEWRTKKILLRDFESIDVDISIRERLGLKEKIGCPSNKALTDKSENYLKRHSFMFDHKLCEYLIDPIVRCAASVLKKQEDDIIRQIKEYCTDKYREQLQDFFPKDNCWYKYPNIEIDRSTSDRPYISKGIAKYR